MHFRPDASRCPGPVRTGFLLALLALGLPGCARLGLTPEQPQPVALAPAAPEVAVVAGDPIAAFAATAAPGAEGQVRLPGSGRSVRVRLLRAYYAASGRECREVLVGTGFEQRSSLVCRQEEGWAVARPLLLGSGSRTP